MSWGGAGQRQVDLELQPYQSQVRRPQLLKPEKEQQLKEKDFLNKAIWLLF